jgi:gamma-glutamyl phosphate reductase
MLPRSTIRLARLWRSGRARMGCVSARCECRSGWWELSTKSRPNVTVDTAVLALKTGNAIVLRGGKEAARSNQRLVEILAAVPRVPEGAIELLDSSTRQSVQELIKARGLVDVIIPRGGAGLISFVTENSSVPVIETGAGNCHIFVDESADFEMADRIVINAKTQRPSVCNAAEKLLVHERIAAEYLPRIVKKLIEAGVEVRGDGKSRSLAVGRNIRSRPPNRTGTKSICGCAWRFTWWRMWTKPSLISIAIRRGIPIPS